jgi:phage terminase Nu1 subunit (DNA packaging protein)
MAANDDGPGLISSQVAQSLLLLPTPADLTKLQRQGWIKPVSRDRWRLVDVVQGAIRALRAAGEEISAEDLARLIDVTPSRLAILANEGVLPKNRHGRYPMPASVQAYVRYLRENTGDGGDRSLSKQRARLTKSKADIAEMERERVMGAMIPTNEVIAMNTAIATTVRTRMLAIASKFAPRLVMIKHANEVEAILRPGIEEGLEELSRLDVVLGPVQSSADKYRRAGNARSVPATAEVDDIDVG